MVQPPKTASSLSPGPIQDSGSASVVSRGRARGRKQELDLLLPGATGWERWTGLAEAIATQAAEFGTSATGTFGREVRTRLLALPLSQVWTLPAWLQGEAPHLRDMALLHLERLGVTVADAENGIQVRSIAAREGAHLVCITALKEMPAPLWDVDRLPDEVLTSAACLPLPVNAMVICRELDRLVLMITHGPDLIYASPLTARELDEHALGEVNHLCLQLGFQGVLSHVRHIIVWLPEGEGDLAQVKKVTGLSALREPRPAPVMPVPGRSRLLPPDILSARAQRARSGRVRLLALSAGLALAAAIAIMAVLISMATQERDLLRDRMASLAPQAAQVQDQKRAWMEAAPAVDPTVSPMQVLLDCQTPEAAAEVSMTYMEWLPDRLLLRGRTPTPTLALQYARDITGVENLTRYTWETPPPSIASDNSATFEVKGALPQP